MTSTTSTMTSTTQSKSSLRNQLTIGFMGFGEIGSSLYRVYEMAGYKNLIKRDPYAGLNDSLSACNFVNVCIPFFGMEKFITSIKELNLRPGTFLIIQSTIGVGTCDLIQEQLDLIVVQSPVRGVHPNLTEGMLTFDKYMGISEKYYSNEKVRFAVEQHLLDLNMKPVVCRAKESELAKAVSTTLYGINIAAINDVAKMCEEHNVSFYTVFTRWQTGYNEGYTKLGRPNVCRPVLTPIPKNDEGKQIIGGHCVLPNAVILKNMGHHDIADYILRYSDKAGLKHVTGAKH